MAVKKKNVRVEPKVEESKSTPWWPMIISFLAGAFLMFILHLKNYVPDNKEKRHSPASQQEKSAAIEPTFDFYTLLPEMETVVETPEPTKKAIVTSPSPTKASSPAASTKTTAVTKENKQVDRYMLQVGSFKKLADADGFKARLAFLGIQSKVQSVTIDKKDTWHRVQVGPIEGRARADILQKQLKENKIDSLLMRANHG